MRAVVQRVSEAKVEVEGQVVGAINNGFVILLGVHRNDLPEDTKWLVNKLIHLRCFQDDEGKMNFCLKDVSGGVLVVSQFTLYGNCTRGRRPDFLDTAPPGKAKPIYEKFVKEIALEIKEVKTGIFGTNMQVTLVNDGPVTFVIDSK